MNRMLDTNPILGEGPHWDSLSLFETALEIDQKYIDGEVEKVVKKAKEAINNSVWGLDYYVDQSKRRLKEQIVNAILDTLGDDWVSVEHHNTGQFTFYYDPMGTVKKQLRKSRMGDLYLTVVGIILLTLVGSGVIYGVWYMVWG